MKRLKDIDFEENARWLDNLTDKERKRLKRIFYKYIKWIDPSGILDEEYTYRIKVAFMDGLLVGMIDI